MDRALAKRPDDRFASMQEFVAALEAIDTGTQRMEAMPPEPTPIPHVPHYTSASYSSVSPTTTRTLLAVALAGATLCAAVLLGLYFLTRDDPATPEKAAATSSVEGSQAESVETVEVKPSPANGVPPEEQPVDDSPVQGPAIAVDPPTAPVDGREPDRAQPPERLPKPVRPTPESQPEQVEPTQPVEPRHTSVEPKPASGPTSAEKAAFKRSIENSCANAVGFQERTATVQVRGSRTNVKVDPPYPLLEKCIEKQLDRAPGGTYTLRLSMKPGGK